MAFPFKAFLFIGNLSSPKPTARGGNLVPNSARSRFLWPRRWPVNYTSVGVAVERYAPTKDTPYKNVDLQIYLCYMLLIEIAFSRYPKHLFGQLFF